MLSNEKCKGCIFQNLKNLTCEYPDGECVLDDLPFEIKKSEIKLGNQKANSQKNNKMYLK